MPLGSGRVRNDVPAGGERTAPNIHLVIPGRRSEAQANPESSNPQTVIAGFRVLDHRPSADDLAPE
jgi:hypothetical protein